MLWNLLKNNWKERLRSPFWTQSIVQSIFLGLLALYFILVFLGLGYMLPEILEEVMPSIDPFVAMGGFMIYYFIFDLFIRFFLQSFPAISVKPYLIQPISKNTLANFLLLRSVPTFFNILPWFALLPFFFRVVLPEQSTIVAVTWLVFAVVLILLSNFLSFYIKKAFDVKPVFPVLFLGAVALLIYLDFNGMFPVFDYFTGITAAVMAQPILILIPILLLGLAYWMMARLFREHTYLDDLISRPEADASTVEFQLFDRFGSIGHLMQLEAKLIWRNKRARTFLYISGIILLYPLIFDADLLSSNAFLLFIGLMLTGMFALNYGQLMLSWNSTHFDFLLTQNFRIREYLRAKYNILFLSCVVLFFLSLPYAFFDIRFLWATTVMFLFNTGVSIFVYMFLATYNSKRIDPGKGGVFNYEGFGASHYLIMIPIMLVPILIYLAFKFMGSPTGGLVAIAAFGLLGVLLRNQLIEMVARKFEARKYILAADMRKK